MAMINYADKVALNSNAGIPNNNKVMASDMNQIKNVINEELVTVVEIQDDDLGDWEIES